MTNNLDVLNVGSEPTFINLKRKEVTDIILATTYGSSNANNWHVSNEESCSDFRHINFNIGGHEPVTETYRNPRRTDWAALHSRTRLHSRY